MDTVTGAGAVRSAVPADAEAIAEVHVACWREAYAHVLSPAFLAALDVDARCLQWARRLANPDPDRLVVVAVTDDRIVGLALSGRSRDTPPVRELQLDALYVLADQHGTGLGQALLDAALGGRPAALWTAEDNPRARAFYTRNGFTPDGARKIEPWLEDLAEVRLARW